MHKSVINITVSVPRSIVYYSHKFANTSCLHVTFGKLINFDQDPAKPYQCAENICNLMLFWDSDL